MTDMPWIRWLDLDTDISDDGALRVSLNRPKPEHFNHNHAINAAVAFGVAEVAGAGAVVIAVGNAVADLYTVIESAEIAYSAPATRGLIATAGLTADDAAAVRAKAEDRAPQTMTVPVTLTDLDGRRTGQCAFHVSLRPRRSAAGR
jgi:hypothetical protein